MGNYCAIVLLLLLSLHACTSNQIREKELTVHDIDLKLAHKHEIDIKLSNLGIIDITALSNNNVIDNLHLKVAREDKNKDEIFSIVLLDKNGNGLHNDYGIDLIALAPNNWSVLSGQRFWYLNFSPLKENHSIYIYGRFETIIDIHESRIRTSLSARTDDFITFPYTIPPLVKKTINEEILDFGKLTKKNKFIFFEFWGTWCKPCVSQIPNLKKLHTKYSDRLIIVGISAKDDKDRLTEVVSHLDMNWPQIQMDNEISNNFGKVNLFPLGILYDQNGKLISYGIKPEQIIKVLSKYD